MRKISIKGPIIPNDEAWIYDFFEIQATYPQQIQDALTEADGAEVELEINSVGGDVVSASEIYTALKDYSGKVTAKIVGIAASAASVIAMAADKVLISPTGQMMIHNAHGVGRGDHREMKHRSDVLKNVDKTIAHAYQLKSGLSDEKLLSMMAKETWLTPKEAVEYGLADEVMFENEVPDIAASYEGMLPKKVVQKIRNMKLETQNREEKPAEAQGEQEAQSDFLWRKFNLLALRKDDEVDG